MLCVVQNGVQSSTYEDMMCNCCGNYGKGNTRPQTQTYRYGHTKHRLSTHRACIHTRTHMYACTCALLRKHTNKKVRMHARTHACMPTHSGHLVGTERAGLHVHGSGPRRSRRCDRRGGGACWEYNHELVRGRRPYAKRDKAAQEVCPAPDKQRDRE